MSKFVVRVFLLLFTAAAVQSVNNDFKNLDAGDEIEVGRSSDDHHHHEVVPDLGHCDSLAVSGSCHDQDNISRVRQHDMKEDVWDERGYVTFCPTIGNFGNQMEQYLGSIVFAKALNRTLILPPLQYVSYRDGKVHRVVHFTDLFQVGPLQEFHRVIPMEVFMTKLAPKHWLQAQRRGYMLKFKGLPCSMKRNRGSYWEYMEPPVEFDDCITHTLSVMVDMEEEESLVTIKNAWNKSFPPADHPVLALGQAPGRFPINPGNRKVQKYIHWTEEWSAKARAYITETIGQDTWVAVHLRNGGDWVVACELDIATMGFFMASPQCHEIKPGAVTKEMCLPSLSHILDLTLRVFQDVNAKHLFIATDRHPYLEDFKTLLEPLGVSVHYLDPDTPQVDLMILAQADYFIGSCVSSFTSFVKRDRDANGRPSIFWGQEYTGFH